MAQYGQLPGAAATVAFTPVSTSVLLMRSSVGRQVLVVGLMPGDCGPLPPTFCVSFGSHTIQACRLGLLESQSGKTEAALTPDTLVLAFAVQAICPSPTHQPIVIL